MTPPDEQDREKEVNPIQHVRGRVAPGGMIIEPYEPIPWPDGTLVMIEPVGDRDAGLGGQSAG